MSGENSEIMAQFVIFKLSAEEFGIPIEDIYEIVRNQDLIEIPQSDKSIQGTLNIRGKSIPVVNLRVKFGMAPEKPDLHTRIIIVRLEGREIGMIVDQISEVINIEARIIDKSPPEDSSIPIEIIEGTANFENSKIKIININKLLSSENLDSIDEIKGLEGA